MGMGGNFGIGGSYLLREDPSPSDIIELFRGTLLDAALTGLTELDMDREDLLGALYAECLEVGLDPDKEFQKKGITHD